MLGQNGVWSGDDGPGGVGFFEDGMVCDDGKGFLGPRSEGNEEIIVDWFSVEDGEGDGWERFGKKSFRIGRSAGGGGDKRVGEVFYVDLVFIDGGV